MHCLLSTKIFNDTSSWTASHIDWSKDIVLLSETMASDLREISKIFQMYYKCSNMWLIHFHIFRRVFSKRNVRIIYLISDTWYWLVCLVGILEKNYESATGVTTLPTIQIPNYSISVNSTTTSSSWTSPCPLVLIPIVRPQVCDKDIDLAQLPLFLFASHRHTCGKNVIFCKVWFRCEKVVWFRSNI